MGWLWYLGTLFPVIGIIQSGDQSMADRYTYIPLIEIFIMIAWGIVAFSNVWKNQKSIFGIISGMTLAALSFGIWTEVRHWQSSEILFTQALAVDANNPRAHTLLAMTLSQKGHIMRQFDITKKRCAYTLIFMIANCTKTSGALSRQQGKFRCGNSSFSGCLAA